jgi:hypothetical protein
VIYALTKKNFKVSDLSGECGEAIKKGFKALKHFYVSLPV